MADIYFLLNSNATGGAEKRMMRVAHRVAQEKLFENVFLLVNPEMRAIYSESKDMIDILNASGLQLQFIQNTKRTPLFIRVFSRLSRMLKIQIMIDYAHYLHLKNKSYLYELLRITKHGDVIHVFLGDASRNGALMAAAYGRTVVIEIVSNRRLKIISEDFATLLRFQKASRSL